MNSYDFRRIEAKWQARWESSQTFRAPDPGDPGFDPCKPKFYVLDMFPYPSGAGLHVGHPLGYIATDIVARYHRMRGYNVLHPMGFDAFGLPAEQYAVETGVHPRITTERNVNNMRRQLRAFGLSYDWTREIATIQPSYYRWTQWIFLQLYESWFDPQAGGARPIAELQARLERGELSVGRDGEILDGPAPKGRPYATLSAEEKAAALDGRRLAYLADVPVNWCPALGTVLANEEVTAEGRSERGDHPVYKRGLRQWMMRITDYAERLLSDLEGVDWPEPIKLMQRNWIGRSEGALCDFVVDGGGPRIPVFTTRPDTLFGATYMVLAPEHPLVDTITAPEQRHAVEAYQREAAAKSDILRQAENKEKTGVFTGTYAINPVNGQRVPLWIADYVLMGYGTGAIMAVPAHDTRDFAFAQKFGIPIVAVVSPTDAWLIEQGRATGALEGDVNPEALQALRAAHHAAPGDFAEAFVGQGAGINSANDDVSLDGLPTAEAKRVISEWLDQRDLGRAQVQYRLRDWLFSRQRYWGEPFPVLHGPNDEVRLLRADELPLRLPELEDFRPRASDDPDVPPQPSLAKAADDWKEIEIDGQRWRRELNTMPQWAGSCWYYLRYIDPNNDQRLVDPAKERYWMGERGVDLYVGGAEHAVLHLLYARFWHKVLHDLGHVASAEPFGRLFNQGHIQAYSYRDERGVYVDAGQVEEEPDGTFWYQDQPVTRTFGKMGKSLKNAVNPDDIFDEYGCDTLRLYEMFMGPLEVSKPWNPRNIVGVHRFLRRIWRNFVDPDSGALLVTDEEPDRALKRLLHKTIAQVTDDMNDMAYNTAIARLIELNNVLVGRATLPRSVAETFLVLLAPIAPHVCEELWERLGHTDGLAYQPWPTHDPALLVTDEVNVVVQVKGKVRGHLQVPAGAAKDAVLALAQADPNVARHLAGKTVRKVIFVPDRLINIVAI